jgi:biotin transporter BioY
MSVYHVAILLAAGAGFILGFVFGAWVYGGTSE